MKRCCFPVWLMTLFWAGCSREPPVPPLAAAASGRTGAEIFESCRICHGTKEMQRGPILDGLPAWYVATQLNKFKSGLRGTHIENRSEALMATGLSLLEGRDDVESVARYIAGLPPQLHIRTVRGDAARGKTLYANCAPCHGAAGEGNIAQKGPPLNAQEDWYLLDQMKKYKAAQRGMDPRDIEGRIMQAATVPMADQDLRDVVCYIAEAFGGHKR